MLEKNMKGKQIIENTRNDMRSSKKWKMWFYLQRHCK